MSIEEFIKIISEELSVRVSDITPQSNLADDLGIDSMSLLQIVTRAEEQLGQEFENLEFENIQTVEQAYDHLLKLSYA
ncbi:MAG: acyl carrier protein [Segetibacter sp.]|jgi:acyl carrier protein